MFEYDLRVLHVCPVYLTLHLHRNPDDPRSVHWPFRHGRSEHVISINQIIDIYIYIYRYIIFYKRTIITESKLT